MVEKKPRSVSRAEEDLEERKKEALYIEITAGCIKLLRLYCAYAMGAAVAATTTIFAAASSNAISGALPAADFVLKYASMSLSREASAGSGPLPALNQSKTFRYKRKRRILIRCDETPRHDQKMW